MNGEHGPRPGEPVSGSTACGVTCRRCGQVCRNNEDHEMFGARHSCGHR